MDRKKILILTLVLVVFAGGAFLISRNTSNKKQGGTAFNPVTVKKEPVNMFGQGSGEDRGKNITDVAGAIEVIEEKTLTIKTSKEAVVVNINGVTPVMVMRTNNKAVVGQMADLKIGDAVKVTYDKITRNAVMIYLNR